MQKMVMVRGPAGSGKSTVAKILQKRLGPETALVEMDKLYYDVLQNSTDHGLILECVTKMADIFLKKGYNVILEGVFTVPYDEETEKLRHERLFRLAKKNGLELKIFFLNISLERAMELDKKRHGSKRLRESHVRKLHEKTRRRRHGQDIEIDVTELTPFQVVKRILKQL